VIDEVLAASGGAVGRPFVIVLMCAHDKRFPANLIARIAARA